MHTTLLRRALPLAIVLAVLFAPFASTAAAPPQTVAVQILALNDFHGNLEPPSGSSGRIGTINAGGVEYLATHIKQLEAANPNTIIVSAGDLIGASPLISALFHDEPTIEAFNLIGMDFTTVGNHEFDEGPAELKRMQEGGCHPVDGCQDGDPFYGAEFRFLAANVVSVRTFAPSLSCSPHPLSSSRDSKEPSHSRQVLRLDAEASLPFVIVPLALIEGLAFVPVLRLPCKS